MGLNGWQWRRIFIQEVQMAKSDGSNGGVVKGKTNTHKSTLKEHTRSQVASAAPRSHAKPPNTPSPKQRAK